MNDYYGNHRFGTSGFGLRRVALCAMLSLGTSWSLLGWSLPGFAESPPSINTRQHNQKKEIHQGKKSGELTVWETKQLRQGQRRIQAMEHKAKSDGVMSPEEKLKIHRALTVQRHQENRYSHNQRER